MRANEGSADWGTKTGVDLSCRRVSGKIWGFHSTGSASGRGNSARSLPRESLMVAIVTTKSVDSPMCPGSETFPDDVNDLIVEELSYVCATCGASVPNFELAGLKGELASV